MQQLDGDLEFVRRGRETGRRDIDDPGRRHHPERRYNDERQGQQRGNVVHQCMGLVLRAGVAVLAQDGHEGLRKRPFGEQPSQQVG